MIMDTTLNKPRFKAMPMAELLHELEPNVYPMPASYSAKKKPGSSQQPNTIEKMKVFTCAELHYQLSMLDRSKGCPKPKAATSVKKQRWDSSAKVAYKRKSIVTGEQGKSISARKMFSFQPKPLQNSRSTMNIGKTNTVEAPKFAKPNALPKKSNLINRNTMNMSGVCKISETPLTTGSKILKNRFIPQHNEKRTSNLRKAVITPKHCSKVRFLTDKAVSPTSFTHTDDESFLLKEQEINNIVENPKEKIILKNDAEVSNLVSTPFKKYRNLKEFFSDSGEKENSPLGIGTTMCFKMSEDKENIDNANVESLCDMLEKTSMNTKKCNPNLQEFMTFKTKVEKKVGNINKKIATLIKVKEVYVKFLNDFNKLIEEGQRDNDTSQSELSEIENETQGNSPVFRPPVVKPPTFKVHRKNSCLMKQAARKSLNTFITRKTPEKKDKALNMYMEMKETMNFLKTPQHKAANLENKEAVDTPTVTSHNLKKQLNKLFNES